MSDKFEVTYRKLFRTYYAGLLFYAKRIVGEEEAEDVVQDVFVELWHKKDTIEIGEQIQGFLYKAVYTRALNVLKHREVKDNYEALVQEIHQKRVDFYRPDNNEVIERMENMDLRKEIIEAIDELPDKCKEVFTMSYLHDMKNREIALALGISHRTVESHMYKALRLLRSKLQHLHVFFYFFMLRYISMFLGYIVLLAW